MQREKGLELLLLDAPSVFDFREKSIFYGPVSDVIPSSPAFEMYPVGGELLILAEQDGGVQLRIVARPFALRVKLLFTLLGHLLVTVGA